MNVDTIFIVRSVVISSCDMLFKTNNNKLRFVESEMGWIFNGWRIPLRWWGVGEMARMSNAFKWHIKYQTIASLMLGRTAISMQWFNSKQVSSQISQISFVISRMFEILSEEFASKAYVSLIWLRIWYSVGQLIVTFPYGPLIPAFMSKTQTLLKFSTANLLSISM